MKKLLILIPLCLLVLTGCFGRKGASDIELTCSMIDGGTTTEYVFTFNEDNLLSFVRTESLNVVSDSAVEANFEFYENLCETENKVNGVQCEAIRDGNNLTRKTTVDYANMNNKSQAPFIHGHPLLESLEGAKEGMTIRGFVCN